jgi:hypothetical protein
MLEALCRQSSTTLDIVHAEDGPPITQRTSGLVRCLFKLDIRSQTIGSQDTDTISSGRAARRLECVAGWADLQQRQG